MANHNPLPPPEHSRFKPGQSGNPRGAPRTKIWRNAILAAIKRKEAGEPDVLVKLADALIEKVRAGDVGAIKEFGDRVDGRVPQPISGDDDADPVTIRTIVTGVPRPDDE